jgi:hypothetical protein
MGDMEEERHEVVGLIDAPQLASRLSRTVLKRPDVNVRYIPEPAVALQALLKGRVDLFLLQDFPPVNGKNFLNEALRAYPHAAFPVVVFYDPPPRPYPSLVRRAFLPGFDAVEFDDAVAQCLNVPTRRSARFPLRIGVAVESPDASWIASSVNVSASGMLVETNKPLAIGQAYQVRFIGGQSKKLPPIKAKVVREEACPYKGTDIGWYAMAFEPVDADLVFRLTGSL